MYIFSHNNIVIQSQQSGCLRKNNKMRNRESVLKTDCMAASEKNGTDLLGTGSQEVPQTVSYVYETGRP